MAMFRDHLDKRQWMKTSSTANRGNSGFHNRNDQEMPNHILLFTILNPLYPITVEALHTICQPIGQVLRIVIFEKNGLKAMVEFSDLESAINTKAALNGADIYSGCCTLNIEFARQEKLNVTDNNSRSWDYTITSPSKNKERSLINNQLDKLFSLKPITDSTASSINALVATISESLNSLNALGQSSENWDVILIHYITHHLDQSTREKWEQNLESSPKYPTLEQLLNFLKCRARALERIDQHVINYQEDPNVKTLKRKIDNHYTNTEFKTSKRSKYPCDCCEEDHFILYCPTFRKYSPERRYDLVLRKQLCLNCFARHDVEICGCAFTCRTCKEKHHSMIHSAV